MKARILLLLVGSLLLLSACSGTSINQQSITPVMSADQARTLASLRKVDDYPLYTMTYYGDYDPLAPLRVPTARSEQQGTWACTLIASFGNPNHRVYGRNFDWDFSPAVILFTHPPHAYASVSMVDVSYLGLAQDEVASLNSSPRRSQLLQAQLLPFDGMNEYGLTIGMASIPASNAPHDLHKPTVGSLRIIRLMLDQARNVDEAIAIFRQYNIDFSGGPSIHYMMADPSGLAATVELKDGAIQITRNNQPWQITTNFYLAGASQEVKTEDWRYQSAETWLQTAHGSATPGEAMQLLDRVKQPNTQWSIVYDMSTGEVDVAMDRSYNNIHLFNLPLAR